MSYFAKPNFIIYDEWFDDDLEKKKLNFQNKKSQNIANMHDFFYEQSKYIIGASENNMQLDMKINKKELIIENYLDNISENYSSAPEKKFRFFENLTKKTNKFFITKKLIYSLSILGFILILGYVIFFISQYKKNESKISTNFYSLIKEL